MVVTHELQSIFTIADRAIMLDPRSRSIIAAGQAGRLCAITAATRGCASSSTASPTRLVQKARPEPWKKASATFASACSSSCPSASSAASLFLLGGRSLFQPTFTFETYFNESVAGLELGAPVRFRGVPLGQVTAILTSAATYERDVPLGKRKEYIVVRAKVDFSAEEVEQMERDAVQMVKRGLRAQTQLAGITGQQYLALDFLDPAKYPPLPFDWTPKYTYVPSAPSLTGEIIANVQAVSRQPQQGGHPGARPELNALVVNLDKKVNEVPVADLRQAHDASRMPTQRSSASTGSSPRRPSTRRCASIDSAAAGSTGCSPIPGSSRRSTTSAAITARLRKIAETASWTAW